MTVTAPHDQVLPSDDGEALTLRLLGRFEVTGVPASALGAAGQRLLALIAVNGGVLARWQAAQALYPTTVDANAAANLRALLWRLQRHCPALLRTSATDLRLAPQVRVDYLVAVATARRLLTPPATTAQPVPEVAAQLREDLLPGWPEPWLVHERERFHQLRLHALEALCTHFSLVGRHGDAVDTGLEAVRADPLRESARRVLIDAYLTEGNVSEAVRQYQAFAVVLHAELGLQPTPALQRRLGPRASISPAGAVMTESWS
ncbi:AfsR/SARP family transcriptional regulator [Solwaraspora sp. WMMB762]|uniref:AfsR/SARP family transcriptional regulator n=1 Tax=Solwaraspora sp. WMMB762 TaxID=3404120 RepID=UPI003B95FEE8